MVWFFLKKNILNYKVLLYTYLYIYIYIYFFNLQQRLLRFSRRRWGQRTSHCCPNQRQLKFSKFHNILWLLLVTTTVPFLRYYISLLNSYVNVKTIWAIIFNLYIKKYFLKDVPTCVHYFCFIFSMVFFQNPVLLYI